MLRKPDFYEEWDWPATSGLILALPLSSNLLTREQGLSFPLRRRAVICESREFFPCHFINARNNPPRFGVTAGGESSMQTNQKQLQICSGTWPMPYESAASLFVRT